MTVELRYGVTFGKGDSSDWIDWEIELTDEEAAIYQNAIDNELPLIKDFVEGFEPYSPYDAGWTLHVEFVDPNNDW